MVVLPFWRCRHLGFHKWKDDVILSKKYKAGDLLKLSYFELLSPDPVFLPNAGGILSPKLRDISSIGIHTYQYYLTILLLDVKSYFAMIGQAEAYEALSEEEKIQLNIFDLLTFHEQSANLLQQALDFFLKEHVRYSSDQKCFLVQEADETVGMITRETYPRICDVICQRNCVKSNQEEDLSQVRSKKALEILKKLQKGRAMKAKQTKSDEDLELGNIISAVANKSPSLNITNIWDLTVFQVWDCFSRLSNNNIYAIQSMSVAAWGNKENYFDAGAWYKRMDNHH